MLPQLFNIPDFNNIESLGPWSFAHAGHHLNVINAILIQQSVALPVYIMDPIPTFNMGQWLYQHQILHNNNNIVLNTGQGNDLTQIDLNNPAEVADWIWLDAAEHRLWANALGVG